MISRRLRPRGHCGSSRLPAPARAPKFDPYEKCPFPLVCGIQYCFGRFSRTLAAAQSRIISAQAYSFHPPGPDAECEIAFGPAASECELTAVGRDSRCVCAAREITTVEIACLKMSCSWLLVSSTTEYLSNDRIRPVSFTPLTR